jgi:chromate transport protein ChrA
MVALFRRIGVAIAGVALILVGIVLLVLPGPGLLLIAAGLGVLATEFPAVRRFVDWLLATRPAIATRLHWQRFRNAVRSRRDARRLRRSL